MAEKKYPLMTLFGRTLKFLTDEFEGRLQQEGVPLTIVEFVLLYRLSAMHEDEITQQHFADQERKHKSVILRQIDGLELKQYVARMPDAADRRKNILVLTQKGLKVLDDALAIENAMMAELTHGLKPQELDTLRKVAFAIQENAFLKRQD